MFFLGGSALSKTSYGFVCEQEYLYGKETASLTYHDFVNKELVLFSNSDNERSIPCMVDGETY